jgi:hypothetical protein
VSVLLEEEVYGKYRPQSAREGQAIVRRYVRRGKRDALPIDAMLGEHRARTEPTVLAGMLGLLKPQEPLGATVQKLAPLWEDLSSLPPPQSIDSILKTVRPHLKTLAVSMYSFAPHYDLSKIGESINQATNAELFEARTYLRNVAASVLRLKGARSYYRRFRKVLALIDEFRSGKKPRRIRQFQDVWTREGVLAFATFELLRVRQAIRETREAGGTVDFSALESASK